MGPDRIDIIRMHTMEQLSGYMYGGINQFSARMHANRSLRDVCFEHDKRWVLLTALLTAHLSFSELFKIYRLLPVRILDVGIDAHCGRNDCDHEQ